MLPRIWRKVKRTLTCYYWRRLRIILYSQIGTCVHEFVSFSHYHGCIRRGKSSLHWCISSNLLAVVHHMLEYAKYSCLFIKDYYPVHVIQNKSWRHPLLTTSCKLESKPMLSAVKFSSTFQRCAMTFSSAKTYIGWLKVPRMQNLTTGNRKTIACYRAEVGIFEFARPRNTDHVIKRYPCHQSNL